MKKLKMTPEQEQAQLVDTANFLKTKFIQGGVDYYQHLMNWEPKEAVWRTTGCKTFVDMLRAKDFDAGPAYERYKQIVNRIGWDKVKIIGFEAASMLLVEPAGETSKVTGQPLDEAVTVELENFVTRNQRPPSPQQARQIVFTHRPVRVTPPKIPLPKTYAQLVKENEKLLARVALLEDENRRLREQLGNQPTTGSARSAGDTRKSSKKKEATPA